MNTMDVSNRQEIKEMVISFLTIVPSIPLADLSCQNELLVWQHSLFPEPVLECNQTEPSSIHWHKVMATIMMIISTQINESDILWQYDDCNDFYWHHSRFMVSMLFQATWHDDTGKFPWKKLCFSEKCGSLRWSVQLKYSCLFKHDTGGTVLQCISHHDALKCQKPPGVLFLPLWHYHKKRAHKWIIKQSPHDLCFFGCCRKMSGKLLQTGWRMVVGGGLKGPRKYKNTCYREQTHHSLHSVAPFCIPNISSAWHLLAGMENDCRWKWKANDLMLTSLLPMWISIK